MEIILDTNFIIVAIKQKTQPFEQIKELFPTGKVIIPMEAIEELEKIKEDKKSKRVDKEAAELAIFMIKKFDLELRVLRTKNVDAGIINYTKDKKGIAVATLDRELIAKIKKKNKSVKFLTIRNKKKIEVQ